MGATGLQSMEAGGAMRPLDGIGLLDVDRLAVVGRAGVVDALAGRAERLVRALLGMEIERPQEENEAQEPMTQWGQPGQPAQSPLHAHAGGW